MTCDIFDNEIEYYLLQRNGVDWVFINHGSYPRPGGIYADAYGVYGDNQVSKLMTQSQPMDFRIGHYMSMSVPLFCMTEAQ